MPSRFDNLIATHLDPYVDEHFGEPTRFIPMRRTPNGRSEIDPDRMAVDTVAVVSRTSRRPGIEIGARAVGRGRNDLRSIVEGREVSASVQASKFTSRSQRPRQGDRVEIDDIQYEILNALADGTGRIVCHLVAVGRGTP